MILPALMLVLQAAPAQPAARAPTPAAGQEKLKAIDSQLAIDLFAQICWGAFVDPDAFHIAVTQAPIPLARQPRPGRGEIWAADEAILTYQAADDLPANIPSRQCALRVRLAGAADQLALAARIATALKLPAGRTRTSAQQSQTEWTVPAADGRPTRLFALTRAAPGGQTELRMTALLLAKR